MRLKGSVLMDTVCYFNELGNEQLYLITGGCGWCIAGNIFGCTATGIGIGGAAGSVPGAIAGGIVGAIVGIMISI